MVTRCVSCCAILALFAAIFVPIAPWLLQRLFWYAHQAPLGQAIHVPAYPPDIQNNVVRGIPTPSFITDRRMDFLENNFTHRPGDVWVITYQKVGTTWTQYIVSLLQGNPRETSAVDLFARCPWPEVDIGVLASSPSVLQQSAISATGQRCFKSHWPRKGFFANLPDESKVIYVLRDAESVAVSYWGHMFNLFGFYLLKDGDITWDQYFEKWFHGDLQMGGYMEHVASWWEARDKANVLILRYEDMRADTATAVRRIANFIGVQADHARLADILDATSKDNMRKWNEGWIDSFLITMGIMRGEHVRRDGEGKKASCTDSQRARLVEKYDKLLKSLGMPYEFLFSN
eukprot:TRINITY_DN5992_c0_g1_i2.p1 TRINITY_DN5992_c0_g1~~TRINITY_DN5992_c0_g1_i2.p1  ORF type:complete len:345 (-),score=43.42 TRINITY_DN5992_c0_g1_i2:31-1065(-)